MSLALGARVASEVRLSASLSEAGRGEAARTLGFWDQAALWASLGFSLSVLASGAMLVPAGSLGRAAASAALGSIAAGAALALACARSAEQGDSLSERMGRLVGNQGAVSAVFIARNLAWGAYLISFMAAGAAYFARPLFGDGTRAVFALAFAALAAALAVAGPHVVLPWLVKRLVAPVALLMVAIIGISSYVEMGIPELLTRPSRGGWPDLFQGADLVALGALAWLPVAGDFSRFSAGKVAAGGAALLGFAPAAFLVTVIAVVYVPAVTGAESWELLTAVPMGMLAFLMLLTLEADGIAVLAYAGGAAARAAGASRLAVTVAGAMAAGALGAAFSPRALEPVALAAGLLFVPPVVIDFLDRRPRRGHEPVRRRRVALLTAWVAAFVAGSVFYAGPSGPWQDVMASVCGAIGLPWPLAYELPLLGALLPTVVVAAGVYLFLMHAPVMRARW